MLHELAIIVGLILLNGVFAGAEIALIAMRRTRLRELAGQGSRRARAALALKDQPERLLATVQMPGGIPVGTLAIGRAGALNAGLLAGAIIARKDPAVRTALARFREKQTAAVPERP